MIRRYYRIECSLTISYIFFTIDTNTHEIRFTSTYFHPTNYPPWRQGGVDITYYQQIQKPPAHKERAVFFNL